MKHFETDKFTPVLYDQVWKYPVTLVFRRSFLISSNVGPVEQDEAPAYFLLCVILMGDDQAHITVNIQ